MGPAFTDDQREILGKDLQILSSQITQQLHELRIDFKDFVKSEFEDCRNNRGCKNVIWDEIVKKDDISITNKQFSLKVAAIVLFVMLISDSFGGPVKALQVIGSKLF